MQKKILVFIAFMLVLALAKQQDARAFVYIGAVQDEPYDPAAGLLLRSDEIVTLPLSGQWRLDTGGEPSNVQVPGCWSYEHGSAILSRTFRVPDSLSNKTFTLLFTRVRHQMSVSLNGRLIEAWNEDWPLAKLQVPLDLIRTDRPNELQVEISADLSARSSIPLKPKMYDPQPYAGLMGDVFLVAGPTLHISSWNWSASFPEDASPEWRFGVSLFNESRVPQDSATVRPIRLQARLFDRNGRQVSASEVREVELDPVKGHAVELTGALQNPQVWSLEQPYRYELRLTVTENDSSWTLWTQVGFREVEWMQGGISLNGQVTRLRGIDYAPYSASHGAAITIAEMKQDLDRIKQAGYNLVRTAYAPAHPFVADYCDQIGLMLIVGPGLHGIPAGVFTSEPWQKRYQHMLHLMIQQFHSHPSVIAWDLAHRLPASSEVLNALNAISSMERQRPFMIGFLEPTELPDLPQGMVGVYEQAVCTRFRPLDQTFESEDVWMLGGLGDVSSRRSLEADSLRGDIRQADVLLAQLREARKQQVAGFLVHLYADVPSPWPSLLAGAHSNWMRIPRGLHTLDRQERIGWKKASEAMGQAKIEPPVQRTPDDEFPLEFPIASLIVIALFLISRRQNNVFKQNMTRVFAHTHGFFVDIRDRRYFQMGQSILVGILAALTLAILLASRLYHARFAMPLDYLLTLFFPLDLLKAQLVRWAWHPLEAIAGFTAVHFVLLIVFAIVLQVLSLPFKNRLGFKQSFNMVTWGASHYLILMPLGLIQYRLLGYPWYVTLLTFLVGIFTLWYFVRVTQMIRIGYRSTIRTAWLLAIGLLVVVFGVWVLVFQSAYNFFEYYEYFSQVLIPICSP